MLRLLLVTSLLLLAGCASPTPDDAPTQAVADEPADLPEPAAPTAAPDPVPVTVTCELRRTNIGTTTGYGLNIDRAVLGISECPMEELFGGNTTWARALLVEATWTTQPTQTGTDLYIESEACPPQIPPNGCQQPGVMGTASPLVLVLDEAELRRHEGQDALVMASGQGFVNDISYLLHLTLFPGDIPAGFTAVA